MCEQWAFSEINLNCGCPSSKVSDRCFGARLMLVRTAGVAMPRGNVNAPLWYFTAWLMNKLVPLLSSVPKLWLE